VSGAAIWINSPQPFFTVAFGGLVLKIGDD